MRFVERSPHPQEAIDKLRAAERLRYQDVEKTLARLQRVPPEGVQAFRAKLRHLRDVGIPSHLPNVGRGRVNDYCSMDCLEILLALRLQSLGQPPIVVAPLANRMMIEYWHDVGAESAGELDDLYVIVYPFDTPPEAYARARIESPPTWFFRGIQRMKEIEKHLPRDIVRLHVSGHARDVLRALEEAVSNK